MKKDDEINKQENIRTKSLLLQNNKDIERFKQ